MSYFGVTGQPELYFYTEREMIDKEILTKTPLFKDEWLPTYNKLKESAYAPKWNTSVGDRLIKEDIEIIERFERFLNEKREKQIDYPNDYVLKRIKENKENIFHYQKVLKDIDIDRDFFKIPLTGKMDLKNDNLVNIIPKNVDLTRMTLNPTSGTTGDIIYCPNSPASVGCYDPTIQYALKRHGLKKTYDHNVVAAIQLCFQQSTITYSTVHSYLKGAGFAKINLNRNDWRNADDSRKYINESSPVFLSGDPYAFYQAAKIGIDYKPEIFLSSAITMEDKIYDLVTKKFQRKIVDFYSMNETGPIAYSCPLNRKCFHIISPDIYLETVDDGGNHIKNGGFGEIVFTGGRNEFLPLLRYKTADFGEIDYSPCSCGETLPTIKRLNARKLVLFRSKTPNLINPVDISKILRNYPGNIVN